MSTARRPSPVRRVCFVTGTRAEFGLMRSTLLAVAAHRQLDLQLVVTGMHLDRSRGKSLDRIHAEGWKVAAVVPWPKGDDRPASTAVATGKAMANLAGVFEKLGSDIVLVVGDRVEAFAAASAAHVSGRLVAHVHGGDRALGLVDDSLRHSISKLAHVHFPATKLSAQRLEKMGEDRWRIQCNGSPGLDDIHTTAAPRAKLLREFPGLRPRRYALVVLHPETSDPRHEARAARLLLSAVAGSGVERVVIVYPNNDPGSEGIAAAWGSLAPDTPHVIRRDLSRPLFLGLLRDAAMLAGNSSSGIIEAASFGTPVLNVGTRQAGREHGRNVVHAPFDAATLRKSLARMWNRGDPLRHPEKNPYGSGGAARRIATALARIQSERFRRKLIAY